MAHPTSQMASLLKSAPRRWVREHEGNLNSCELALLNVCLRGFVREFASFYTLLTCISPHSSLCWLQKQLVWAAGEAIDSRLSELWEVGSATDDIGNKVLGGSWR